MLVEQVRRKEHNPAARRQTGDGFMKGPFVFPADAGPQEIIHEATRRFTKQNICLVYLAQKYGISNIER
jgi:hypothetical protein